jgi:3-dehydroquinate synthase
MSSQKIPVQDYEIHVGSCLSELQQCWEDIAPSRTFILVDEQTEKYCLPLLMDNAGFEPSAVITIPSGEKYKSLSTCEKIWRRLFDLKADRNALLINLGGGVIGDMGGFCASTYMRGFSFIQVPTTLLAQVDASIGGKLGIDYYDLKNAIGLFRNPVAVFMEPAFLQSLPSRELRSGYAEVVKHGLIHDRNLWDACHNIEKLNEVDWNKLILPSLDVKKYVVDQDPLEKGLRKILNFGHTIGHAVESVRLEADKPLLHGEAIVIGMITEAYLSHTLGRLPESELEQITRYLLEIYGKQELKSEHFRSMIRKMTHDKKNRGQEINFTFLEKIGKAVINQTAEEEAIKASLSYYQKL